MATIALILVTMNYTRPVSSSAAISPLAGIVEELEGSTLPAMEGLRTAGGDATPRPWETPKDEYSLLIYFRSDCVYCEATAPHWRALIARLPGGTSVLGLNTESPEVANEWLAAQEIAPDLIIGTADPSSINEAWHLPAVPSTLLISRTGEVLRARIGALTREDEEAFVAAAEPLAVKRK
jgi:thiol-disulfide isomerase/thioredoxin